MGALVEGVVAGLGIAVPVGAIAVLIVDLGMRQGFARAVPAAMGAASADLAYAAVAAVAGIAVAAVLAPYERGIELLSATVLAGIVAYRMVRLLRAGNDTRPSPTGDGAVSTYAGFLALTLVNPLTVTYFAALILGLGDDKLGSGADKALFVVGAFVASAAWQLVLAGVGAVLHHRLSERALLSTSLVGNLLICSTRDPPGVGRLVSRSPVTTSRPGEPPCDQPGSSPPSYSPAPQAPAPVGGGSIPPAVRRSITHALVDVGPLTFVPSPDAPVDRNGCARVRDDGILITLGPVDGTGDRIQVGVNGFLACLGANSLTYRVQQTTSGRMVSGITARGPVA